MFNSNLTKKHNKNCLGLLTQSFLEKKIIK
jgi:hypothetical protein